MSQDPAALREPRAQVSGPQAWLERYRKAAWAGDGAAAAEAGEAVLDLTRSDEVLSILAWPFPGTEFQFPAASAPSIKEAVAALDRSIAARPTDPWGYLLRGLLVRFGEPPGPARADLERLSTFPVERYGWMRLETALMRLQSADFTGAAGDFAAVAVSTRPGHWRAQAFLAEALLCGGDGAGSAAAMDKALELAPAHERGGVLAWRGEHLLWTGAYAQALDVLDEALKQDGKLALGWKGGALVKLGRFEESLEPLARAIAYRPNDAEARVWRMEALLRLGRTAAALEESRILAERRGGHDLYVTVLGALAGGPDAAARAVSALPRHVAERVCGPARSAVETLERLLVLSRGVRRGGHEVWAWMRETVLP